MKTKKLFTKNLLVLLLCLGFLTPIMTNNKQPIPSDNNSAAPCSDLIDFPSED